MHVLRLSLAVGFILAGAASAAAQDVTRCDDLAAYPLDPDKVAEGSYDIDGEAAEKACRDALKGDPKQMRFVYQLARALEAQDKFDEAEKQYLKAIRGGYRQALHGYALFQEAKPEVGEAEYKKEAEYLQKALDAGLTYAAGDLAYLYDVGSGFPQDYVKAEKYYRIAAESGDAWSQNHLGYLYGEGLGTPVDDDEAFKWYKAAADQGFAAAQYNVGLFYYEGRSVEANLDQAVHWYQLGAAQDDPQSLRQMAKFSFYGYGVPQDTAAAEDFLRRELDVADGDELWEAQNQLAWFLALQEKNLDEASDLVATALEAAPADSADYPDLLDTSAWISHLNGDDETARDQLNEAIDVRSDFPPFHDHLGDVLAALGDSSGARQAWQAALDLEWSGDPLSEYDPKAVRGKLKIDN